jgi:hypothetical protein
MRTEEQVERLQKLSGIAERIKAHYRDVQAAERLSNNYRDEVIRAGSLYEKAQSELQSAILLCGKALIEARELVPHGEWRAWLGKHGFSKSTAHRYILAARPNVPGLGRLLQLTYGRFVKWAKRVPTVEVVLSWPQEQQRLAMADLEPAAGLYAALQAALPPPGKESFVGSPSPAGEATGADFHG